ncbi:MAG: tetratricopeptide repeat protein [Methylobacter sp.]|nr:tetratricopeptide repeat protein [Methylobacter sp.]
MNHSTDNSDLTKETLHEITFDDALQIAIRLHQSNEYEYAEDVYRKLIELRPDNPNLLHFFGLLRHQRGYSEEGTKWIKKALELVPDYLDAENNLANIYLQTGHPELAEPIFRLVIKRNPDFHTAYGNLGVVLNELEKYHESLEYLLKAIDFQPSDAHNYQNIGNVYRNLKKYQEAVGMYRKTLELLPFDGEAYRKLSRTFFIMGQIDNCIDILKQWLTYDPENATALHLLAAYTNTNMPSRASNAYVRETFDGFAASFDGVLKRLEYQAPFLVHKALGQLDLNSKEWNVLDIGCGTGLCGALIRPMVGNLVGVDLSSKMLERAKAREIYDELIEAELTEFCSKAQSTYNAITCVDTFCYFGDLTDAMKAAGTALIPNGWFIFTLEKLVIDDATENFRLNQHGRYSHTEDYLNDTLLNAGFQIHSIETSVLRRERNEQVAGLVVTAQFKE